MKLGKNFTLDEMVRSQVAARHGIDNTPSDEVIENLQNLVNNVLQPLRNKVRTPIIVTSGFRCRRLNSIIKGAENSQHMLGEAADFVVSNLSPPDLAGVFRWIIKHSDLPYDQVIFEFGEWIHISHVRGNRRQALEARRDPTGRLYYIPIMKLED